MTDMELAVLFGSYSCPRCGLAEPHYHGLLKRKKIVRELCEACRGKGMIPVYGANLPIGTPCGDCDGTGVIETRTKDYL